MISLWESPYYNYNIMYPLYDELAKGSISDGDFTIKIKKVCLTINHIANHMEKPEMLEHYNEILALIIHHHYLSTGNLKANPYDGKGMAGGKGVLYNITNLPVALQRILALYVERYAL